MTNKHISKNLLSSVQKIIQSTKGHALTDELIDSLTDDTKPLVDFYEVSHFQAIVLSLYLDCGLRDICLDTERLVDYFGKSMSVLADIHQAIDELMDKKMIYYRRHSFDMSRKTDHNKPIQVHDKILAALLKGDKTLMESPKVEGFNNLLWEVRDMIVKRIDKVFSTDDLVEGIMSMLDANAEMQEIKWLKKIDGIDKYDIAVLLNITIEHMEGIEECDISKIVNEVHDEARDRIRYKRSVKENHCPLFTLNLLQHSDEDFSFSSYVRLSDDAMEVLLGGCVDVVKKPFKPKFGTLIDPNKIKEEKLFFNEEEQTQIDKITKALQEDKYKEIVKKMQDNGLKGGVTILSFGAAGTGKTSSAYQIAKATDRFIYFIEMDKIQSKWVGESEKNAKAIFEEIEKCSKFLGKEVIAVFNEADAVIGKRMEANSSVDKSFNTLTNIFLQAFEDYKGIAILTTNLANHFDEAFMRRILFRIQFHKPELSVRKKILTNVFSNLSDTMIDKINEDFEFTGAQIANVRKKILIKEILEEEDHNEEYIFKLCQEEQVLTKAKRANIGFIQ